MKQKSTTLVAILFGALAIAASPVAFAKGQVEVVYDHPEKFTDVKDSYLATDRGRDALLETLKEHIQKRAAKRLAEGQLLTLTFTNIDLAGEYEPQNGPDFNDIRVIKAIYPPRLNFTYKLTDASGAVIKEGKEQLTDLAFQSTASPIDRSDTLRFEKELINNWIHDQLPKPKKH